MENKILTANGIEIFSYPNRHTHSFCLSLYIRAGALYESDEENGITHFLEHILFRNIDHRMDGQLYRQLDQLGLFFNGATYKEFIQLYIIGAPRHFSEAADILLKAFEPLTLPADQIRTEQQRVKAEIREAGDFKTLDYFAGTLCWKDTSLRNTILGTKGNVSTFSRRKLAAYHSQAFCPENLFFYVTGCVSEADLSGLAEQVSRLGPLSKGVRRGFVIMVPQNGVWGGLIETSFGHKARKITRFATRKDTAFDQKRLRELARAVPAGMELRELDQEIFQMAKTTSWCVDWVSQYETYEDYRERGIGVVLTEAGAPVSGASSYSSYDGGIEIEIDTREDCRRQGFARICGAALILRCLREGLYPSWDAHNEGSLALAEQLGYVFDRAYTAYEMIFTARRF